MTFSREQRTVDVHDMRGMLDKFTLREKGIELHRLEIPGDIRWDDDTEVYTPETP